MNDLSSKLIGKKLLIFDFDGTIVNTLPLHAKAFKQTLSPLGIEVDYSKIAGLKTVDAIRKCLLDSTIICCDEKLQELVAAKQKAVRNMISQELIALPGVNDFLCWAQARYGLSIATSGSRETVELSLRKLGYLGFFEPVVCAEDVERSKPAPDSFLQVLRLTGTAHIEALVFEDSEAGFQAARSAGLDFVDVTRLPWHRWLQ
jgi:beta-phosphoglucomutase